MKKILLSLFAAAALAGAAFATESPIKLSLYDTIAWPEVQQTYVVLGLVDNNTPEVTGLNLNFISARADKMVGLQGAFAYSRAYSLRGVHGAIYSLAQDTRGVEWGFINHNTGYIGGVQLGAVNLANEISGVQVGFFNKAESVKGVQFGFVNYAERFEKGIQIGLANMIKQDGQFPFMVLVNGRF